MACLDNYICQCNIEALQLCRVPYLNRIQIQGVQSLCGLERTISLHAPQLGVTGSQDADLVAQFLLMRQHFTH